MTTDEKYMMRCLQLARCGRNEARPNPMVGAVIVADGRIIGEGYHIRCGEAHAEVNAFRSVKKEDEHLLPEATVYVSLEPCAHYGKTPPCADLIVSKGVRRVVVGCLDPFAKVQGRGIKRISEAGIEVKVGVLEEECQDINRSFFTYHSKKRPYITLKWAQTQNGFIDDCHKTLHISSPFTQMLVHKMRAENDAIVVGRITDECEHPQLNVRHWAGRSPHRYVLSCEMPISKIIDDCYRRGLQSLIVEGGRKTLQSFIDQQLFDCIRIETAPITVSDGTPAPLLPKELRMVSKEHWDNRDIVIYKKPVGC